MRAVRYPVIALGLLLVLTSRPVATAPASQPTPLYQQFLSPASPLELVAAKRVDRVAWVSFEEGKRNAYTAVAPAFTPVRLTSFLKDDGIDTSGIRISDDGSTVIFMRGTVPNRDGWVANHSGSERVRARDLGGSHGRRRAVKGRHGRVQPGARAGRERRAVREGRADLSREGQRRAPGRRRLEH